MPNQTNILTLHPRGKQGVNISKKTYDTVKNCLLDIVKENPGINYTDFQLEAQKRLQDKINGSAGWYTATIKLDLEARGMILNKADTSPQTLFLGKA